MKHFVFLTLSSLPLFGFSQDLSLIDVIGLKGKNWREIETVMLSQKSGWTIRSVEEPACETCLASVKFTRPLTKRLMFSQLLVVGLGNGIAKNIALYVSEWEQYDQYHRFVKSWGTYVGNRVLSGQVLEVYQNKEIAILVGTAKNQMWVFHVVSGDMHEKEDQVNEFKRYTVPGVGYITVPNNMMELKNNKADIAFGGKHIPGKAKQSTVILLIATVYGDYNPLEYRNMSVQERLELDAYCEDRARRMYGTELLEWYGARTEYINGNTSAKSSCLKRGSDGSIVVTEYAFNNKDRMHTLLLSYPKSEEGFWKPLLEKSVSSFTITNIR